MREGMHGKKSGRRTVKLACQWAWLAMLMGGMLQGCIYRQRLVVYADPWLEAYARGMVAVFEQTHPDVEVQLKVLSSEVVVQHIRYGQPVDVFLCFGSEWYPQRDFLSKVKITLPLADTRVVEVLQADDAATLQQELFQTTSCVVVEASDRPLRRYVERAFGPFPRKQGCTLIANFQRQMVDYLGRGWAPRAYLPRHAARMGSQGWMAVDSSAMIPHAFTAMLLEAAPHAGLAQEFFTTLQSQKSTDLLGELGFLP